MNNKFCILLLGMFALASSALNAQTTAVSDTMMLSVDDCVKIALNENPTIKIADMEITRVDYSKKETIGQLFPNVSFSAAYSRTLAKQTMYMNNGGQTMAIKMGRDNTHNTGFNASMPLISVALWKSIKLSDNQILQNIEASRTSRISSRIPARHFRRSASARYSSVLWRSSSVISRGGKYASRFGGNAATVTSGILACISSRSAGLSSTNTNESTPRFSSSAT